MTMTSGKRKVGKEKVKRSKRKAREEVVFKNSTEMGGTPEVPENVPVSDPENVPVSDPENVPSSVSKIDFKDASRENRWEVAADEVLERTLKNGGQSQFKALRNAGLCSMNDHFLQKTLSDSDLESGPPEFSLKHDVVGELKEIDESYLPVLKEIDESYLPVYETESCSQ